MAFDIEMIQKVYSNLESRIEAAKKVVGKPLTLTEKILYSHLWKGNAEEAYSRGTSYVDFAPDRVAMQDATAQMDLLQFMQAKLVSKKLRSPANNSDEKNEQNVGSATNPGAKGF